MITCSFTKSGAVSSAANFFTIVGNYSDSKGTATIDGTTYSNCLKMESSTSVKFTLTKTMKITLYFASTETGKKVKIDGTEYTTDSNATVEVMLSAGAHEITKKDTINLFYIKLETKL